MKTFAFLCFISTLYEIETARILAVFPSPSISHQVVFQVLTQELVRRGHEVVVITTDVAFPNGQAPANLTEIDVHDISYRHLREFYSEVNAKHKWGEEIDWLTLEQEFQKYISIVEIQVKSEPVQKLIQEKSQFDILLIEAFIRPTLGYSHLFKAPVIQVSSFGATLENLESFGAPTHPILYPSAYRQRLHNLSLLDKVRECYHQARYMYSQQNNERFENELIKRLFGSDIPSIAELSKNVDMLLLNVHSIWMHNQPVPPGIVFMGGLHQKPVKELPRDLKSYLDSSKYGVVYVSFGTNVHPFMFPPERLKVITEAFSELPYDILFKWNDDNLPGRSKNIKISKWLPQSDLLRHPNIKAFVMQGGLQSTDEAITAGVPLICIPMIGDQWYNGEKYVHLNIGLKLNFLTFDKSQLRNAIETVITETSYRENITKLRERLKDQPQSPLERAIWWVEYVLRHGGAKHLRAPAAGMSWTEYYEIELVLIVLTCFLISMTIVSLLVISLYRCVSKIVSSNVKVKKS